MQIDPPVEHETDGASGRYVIRFPDGTEGEMTYRGVREGVIAIDHTYVPPRQRGRGHAERLVAAGLAGARAEGLRILPLCSYVAAQFRRHSEWAELRA